MPGNRGRQFRSLAVGSDPHACCIHTDPATSSAGRQDEPGGDDLPGRVLRIGVDMSEDVAHKVAAGGFTELQQALLGTESVEQFLQELALLAARLVANGLSCGMTIRPNGRPVTAACSDPLAAQVDEVQYRLDDGPCLHAMRQGILVRIDDTAERARWPRFESKAASHDIGSCLALPLIADGKPVGAR